MVDGDVTTTTQPLRTSWLQIIVVCCSEFVLWTGFSAIFPYLPIFLREEGHSSLVMIGFIAAGYYVGMLAFSAPFGWLSDTIGRKPVMIGGMALFATASFLFTRTTSPEWFLLLRLLDGMGAAAGTVMLAFVADISAPARRSMVYGVIMSAQFGGAMAGPALGAALYHFGGGGRGGFHTIFYFAAMAGAAAVIALAVLIREPAATRQRKAAGAPGKRRPSYRTVLTPAIISFLVIGLTGNFAMGGLEVVFSLHLQHLGASMTTISLIWTAWALPMLLAFAGGALADRYSRFVLMVVSYAVGALGYVAFGLTTSIALMFVVAVVQSLAYAVGAPAKQALLIKESPARWLGTVTGLDMTFMQLGGLAGTLLVPIMYGAISGYVIAVCGAVGLVGLAIGAPMLRRSSRQTAVHGVAEGEASVES